jgi:hypothetical protein
MKRLWAPLIYVHTKCTSIYKYWSEHGLVNTKYAAKTTYY